LKSANQRKYTHTLGYRPSSSDFTKSQFPIFEKVLPIIPVSVVLHLFIVVYPEIAFSQCKLGEF